jgi:gliding motility-associated-like protein
MVGDGFGGRLWYSPTNYTVGSYSAYSVCYSGLCGDGINQLYGWGNNNYNQLGLGASFIGGVHVPTAIPNMSDVKYYSTGYIMGAIKNDKTGWAWGGNITGNPIQVISDVKFLDASSTTISWVKDDGTVWSIGENFGGNFGDGTNNDSPTTPIQMQNISTAVRVANNRYATIVLLADSSLMSVGDNSFGCLGVDPLISSMVMPIAIQNLPPIIDIKSHAKGTIALSAEGKVFYWGHNNSTYSTFLPIQLPNLDNIVAISACDDGFHFLALDEYKNCYAWENNSSGQCGVSSTQNYFIDTPQIVATDVIDIMAGEWFSYLVKSDGSLWSSGFQGAYSIWLDLPNLQRDTFTLLDPSSVPEACSLFGITSYTTPVCNNDPNLGSITVSNYGGQEPYSYSIGGGFQNSNEFTEIEAGTYDITVQDDNGCAFMTTAIVNIDSCSSLSTDTSDIPIDTTTDTTIDTTIVDPIETFIDFYSVFSPNNDGKNDLFYFPNVGYTDLSCEIYNRWGTLIYAWNDTHGYWNGTNMKTNNPVSEGVYYYVANYKKEDEAWERTSNYVTLLR